MNELGIVILAAGKGKRMGSVRPKVMFELDGAPLIEHVIETALKLNPARTAVVVGFGKDMVIRCVSEFLQSHNSIAVSRFFFVTQERQLGTGHAVQQAETVFNGFNGTVLIFNGDVPCIGIDTVQCLLAHHNETGAGATILTADYENPAGYGRIVRNPSGDVVRIIEEKDACADEKLITEVNTGTFVFQSDALFPYLSKLKQDNAQQEFYITDIIEILRECGIKISAWKTLRPVETFGVNTPEQLETLHSILHNKNG